MADLSDERRRYEVHRLLKAGKSVVASRLAREWNCSARSVIRSLERMQANELPVEYDRQKRVWRYVAPVADIPIAAVSAEDRRALLFALSATGNLEGLPVGPAVRRLYEKLLATLPPEKVTDWRRMMQQVRFAGPGVPQVKPDVWAMVLLCMEARETMHITYTDGVYGKPTWRDMDPYGLIMRDRRWVLVGYCHLMEEVRTFSLHRIGSAESTDRSFALPEGFMDQYMEDAFDGYQSMGEKAAVRLRISKDAPPYVRERQWSEKERRHEDGVGRLLVEFRTAAIWALQREVLAHAPWVEVIEPTGLRREIRDLAKKLVRLSR